MDKAATPRPEEVSSQPQPQPQYTDTYAETKGSFSDSNRNVNQVSSNESEREVVQEEKKPWWKSFLTPGSVAQIITAAVFAIAIGLGVKSAHPNVPQAATVILGIPGVLWLRALKAVVLPLIATAIILSIIQLREMSKGGAVLARWSIIYFVATTVLAVSYSAVLVSQVWGPLLRVVSEESRQIAEKDKELFEERQAVEIHQVVADMFNSLVTDNPVNSLAQGHFLAVLVAAVVVGYLIKPGGSLLRAVTEIDKLVTIIITALIKMAPIGVFFLILPNIMRLNIAEIGYNLGIFIGGTLTGICIQLFVVYPILYIAFVRKNPFTYWFKNSPAWVTAWGTASSAATLPVTLRCVRARGISEPVTKFVVPLGCLINMDGTAIYFPVVVVFLAATQGITLNAADYIIVILLSTLASIGTTPIPSSSLVLVVMIAGAINVPLTGMYAVVVAIDWFLDRFRTLTNVTGDMYAAAIMQKVTGIKEKDDGEEYVEEQVMEREGENNTSRV